MTHNPQATTLITGASGLLGSAVCAAAGEGIRTIGVYREHPARIGRTELTKIDLSDFGAADAIARLEPGVIIHCAAFTQVDRCESHPEEAHRHNVLATREVARAARRCGAYLIHISTDAVFSGNKGNYSEEDIPDPVSVYAKSKVESEKVALDEAPGALVARTTIYGWNVVPKLSLADWVLSKLVRGEEVPGFTDAIFSPLFTGDLAHILWRLSIIRPSGILHLGSRDFCSKFTFAREIAALYGFDPNRVKETLLADANLVARRPANVSMVVTKAEGVLGARLPGIREGLAAFRETGIQNGQKYEHQTA